MPDSDGAPDLRASPLDSAPRARLPRWPYVVASVLVAAGLFHLLMFAVDDRPWEGPVSWRKPFTFGVSFGLTLATIVWLAGSLQMRRRTRSVLLAIFAVDCVVEVAGITVQAWRGEPSHLNTSSPLNAGIAYTLAAGGAVLIITLGYLAVVALRGRIDGPPSRVLAYRAGFGLLLAGLGSGAAMIAVGTVAMRTGTPAEAYAVAGFLKPFHAVTLHAVLVLPAIAHLLEHWTRDEPLRRRFVAAAAVAYTVIAVLLLFADLTGIL